MKKLVLSATILVAAIAAVVAWRAHARLAAARATLGALNADCAKLNAGIAAARARTAAERRREAELAAAQRRPPPPAPAATVTAAAATDRPDTALSLDRYPGLRALFRRSVAGKLALRYGAFYRTAKLTAEQIRNFERVMTDAAETKMDFELAARSQGFQPNDPALAAMRARAETKLAAALTDALGASGYEEYQQYQRIEPLTHVIGDMTTIAVQHNTPFTAAQADRLMTAMANASSTYQAGGKVDPPTVDWAQVLVEVQPFLSPLQFAVVRQEGDMQQVYRLLKQFYAERKSTGGPKS